MRLKKEFIGVTIKVKDLPAIVIEDNPEMFDYYKKLGLDIFIKERKKKDVEADKGND